jgi:hypothetical protein
MFERVIYALLYLCGIFALYWIIIWVIGALGIPMPPHLLGILMVVMVLLAILVLYRLFFYGTNFRLWPGP